MDDSEFLRLFEARRLPHDQWTHRAHVKMAFLYLSKSPFDEALHRTRAAIKAYIAHHAVPESPIRGYRETTTRAFLHLVAATMHAYGAAIPCTDADSFCDAHPQLMTRHILRLFYSPERLGSPEAKVTFVEPDLAPLPRFEIVAESD